MSESTKTPLKGDDASTIRGSTGTASDATGAPTKSEQLIVTRNAVTGEIENVEFVNSSGQRAQIPEEQIHKIAGEDEIAELQSALDEAFDAGVGMLLEETTGEDFDDGDDRLALVRLMLIPLVGRTTARRIEKVRRKLFNRLVLRRLIRRYALHKQIATS